MGKQSNWEKKQAGCPRGRVYAIHLSRLRKTYQSKEEGRDVDLFRPKKEDRAKRKDTQTGGEEGTVVRCGRVGFQVEEGRSPQEDSILSLKEIQGQKKRGKKGVQK